MVTRARDLRSWSGIPGAAELSVGVFELVIALLFVGAMLALWANRLDVPYPALLALVGALLALVPGTPMVALDPELALALFVAPTLLDAAYDASPRDLRRNLVPITSLAVVMVAVTVIAVASFVRLVVPELGWAAAIALGAIVAPPDTSAAFAVLRKLKPPHHLLVILEGEGLFNDAMALLVYRSAVGVALTGAFSAWGLVPTLLLTCVGGTFAGWLLARIQIVLFARIADIPISILLQFVSTFVVWLLAERLGLSPIITVVAFAMTLARHVPVRLDARHRVATYAVWDVAVLVLNVLAFVLVGLQLGAIIDRVGDGEWRTFAIAAGVVCATIIAVRIAWIMLYTALDRRWGNLRGTRPILGRRAAVLASWCGMRGIVTLATALALPAAFPYRDLILFCAFCAVLATLVIQGMTVRPLMKLLGLHDDHTVEREVTIARVETSRAALRVFETAGVSSTLRDEYQARVVAAEAGRIEPDVEDTKVALRAVEAQREALTELRARYVIGDHAFHVVEEEIDFMELNAATTR